MLSKIHLPGLFITATDTNVGKTLITAALADWFRRHRRRAGVCKPAATGCVKRREGLVSEDAEFIAHYADTPLPLDIVCPQRYVEPLAPAISAQRAKQPLDWAQIDRALAAISAQSDLMLIEGIGGVMVPMDDRHTVLDMIGWLGLPVLIVTRPDLGTINHTLLTVQTLRSIGAKIAGIIINRYPADGATTAQETNPKVLEKWSKLPILTLVPDTTEPLLPTLPADITAAIDRVDWPALL